MTARQYIRDIISFYFTDKISITLFITNQCNINCKHCFYSERINKPTEQLSLDEIKKIAKSIKPFYKDLSITGGEPFLREDIADIFKVFIDEGINNISVNSNGYQTEKILNVAKYVNSLNPSNFSINISLDGLKTAHDDIRNCNGSFDHAITTIKELQKLGVEIKIITVLNALNYKEFNLLYEFCLKELKIKPQIEIIRGLDASNVPPEEANNYYNPFEKKLIITKDITPEIRKILKAFFITQIKKEPKKLLHYFATLTKLECFLDIIDNKKNILKCFAGNKHIVIYENGDLAQCEMMLPIGNLRNVNFDIRQLLHNDIAKRQQKVIKNCYCTHSCYINVVYSMYFMKRLLGIILRNAYK